eukprot:scaffold4.g4944.t1
MINLGQRQRSGGSNPSSPHAHLGHSRAAEELRLQKELTETELPSGVQLSFPHGKDRLADFHLTITPEAGCYRRGTFLFRFQVPQGYPQDPPKVRCLTKVFHPSIDPEGHTDLPFLREGWSPEAGNLRIVIYALCQLFQLPDRVVDALNHDAGEMLHRDHAAFEAQVQQSVRDGATIGRVYYPPARGEETVTCRGEED